MTQVFCAIFCRPGVPFGLLGGGCEPVAHFPLTDP
jgi:hypothetical protein